MSEVDIDLHKDPNGWWCLNVWLDGKSRIHEHYPLAKQMPELSVVVPRTASAIYLGARPGVDKGDDKD